MYVLDTDVISEWHKGNQAMHARVSVTPDLELCTTIVTRIEILRARFDFLLKAADGQQLRRAQQRLNDSERLLGGMSVLSIDDLVVANFESLKESPGIRKIGRADLLIACIALAHDATLVTRNTKDFVRIPNLKLENWIDN